LVMLNLAGGDCVEDLRRLEGDEGFCKVLRRVELDGLSRKERRAEERRWRKSHGLKEKRRTVPLIFGGIRGIWRRSMIRSRRSSGNRARPAFLILTNTYRGSPR